MYKYRIIDLMDGDTNKDDVEGFSIKLDGFKESDKNKNLSFNNRNKLNKKYNKKKKKNNGKGRNSNNKEDFSDTEKNLEISKIDIKNNTIDYYNSFNKGIMKKKSQSTSESIEKFSFLKDKLFEIFDS